jgi:hypothetical protein
MYIYAYIPLFTICMYMYAYGLHAYYVYGMRVYTFMIHDA